jgi:hypothetical protein
LHRVEQQKQGEANMKQGSGSCWQHWCTDAVQVLVCYQTAWLLMD